MSGIQHSREMSIIINFSDIIITERLTSLDLSEIPKIIRAHLFDKLDSFTGLKILNLGSGSGGWSDLYISKFISGIRQMKYLTSFSLCYDCNDDILKILTRNCKTTLRVVDVEMCKRVTNQGAEYLSSCNKIEKLHLFHTGINSQGHMNLVLSLKNLKILVRGDFLCETLELIDKDKSIKKVELRLEEFWSSEEYYFHDLYQMQLVQKYCPVLRKIMFQFSKEVMQNVLFLADFKNLSELHLWGGDFYEDGINQLLEQIGPQLIILYLIHTENMDKSAIILISRVCPNLQTLGLYNCELQEDVNQDENEGEDVDHFESRNTRGFREPGYNKPQMEPLLEISVLHIVSECPESIFLLLLSSTLNVEEVKTGIHCKISDATINKILQQNGLRHLQSLTIPGNETLTYQSIWSLLYTCTKLKYIRDLDYWTKLSIKEVTSISEWIVENNFKLDIGQRGKEPEEQKYLDNLPSSIINYLMGK